jgi:hypothetical protein
MDMMMFTSYEPVYGADFSAKSEYSNSDWNQVKGIRDCTPRGFVTSLLSNIKSLRKQELETKAEREQKRLENEEKNKKEIKEIEIPEESDNEDEVSSPIACKASTPSVVKFDSGFPTISQANTMKSSINDDDWTVVKCNNKKTVEVSDKKKSDFTVKKSQMCNSVKTNSRCMHGKSCRFAHDVEELTPVMCQHGKNCKFVSFIGDCYRNNGNKLCTYQHTDEKIEEYLIRSGLKQRGPATEEEMQQAFEEYLKHVEVADIKSTYKQVDYKKFEYKKFENVQNKPIKTAIVSNKPVVFKNKNLETIKIEKRNEVNIKIRDLNLSIKRNGETLTRFKGIRDVTDFYKKQMSKLEEDIKNKKNEIKKLEEQLVEIAAMKEVKSAKPVENIQVIKTDIKKVVQVAVKKVVASVVLYIAPKIVKQVAVVTLNPEAKQFTPVSQKNDDGWIEVKKRKVVVAPVEVIIASDRDSAFNILKNTEKINITRTKTKMCFRGKECRYKGCSFAHSESELKVSNCIFGDNCKFVKKESGILVNACKTQMCHHKHQDETLPEFYFRLGIRKM